jgi:tungstate transport system ATP-binding protein
VSLYQLKNLKQVFDGRTVLDIENLEFEKGGSYALLGPNGCGKTTLLHILAFLKPPASGQVMYKGRPVDWREKHLGAIRRQVVLVDQHPIMFSTTVSKNVEYGLKMRGLESGERRKIALECLDRVGMKDFAHRPGHLLSGGETQRVAIARAMACRPQVMLFDEPTASVDVENQAVIESVIRDIRAEKGITVIFSTHKRLEAARLGENKVFMFEGKLTGPGGENLLSGMVVSRGGQNVCLIGENVELKVASEQTGQCRVFVRPEKIRIYRLDKSREFSSGSPVTGRVLQMTAEGGHIKVLLDAGVPLRTIMTRQEAVESGIFVGDQVRIEFDPDAAYTEP